MKLIAQTYVSPLLNQGTFENVTIEDVCLTHKRHDNYIAIGFEMSYIKNGQKVVLDKKEMGFQGMENDIISTNKTTLVSIDNPDYDAQTPESKEKITVALFDSLGNFTFDVTTIPFEVVDFGYPTYEKVMQYFSGGTLESPEINITSPLAIGFLMNNLIMNGEAVGNQFTLV